MRWPWSKPKAPEALHTYTPVAWVIPWDEQRRRWPCLETHAWDATCEHCGQRQANATQEEIAAATAREAAYLQQQYRPT